MTYKVKIITVSRIVLECSASLVLLPGEDGMLGVMQSHEPLITNLKPGVVEISSDTVILKYFIYGGIAKITDEEVEIITEFALDLGITNKDEVQGHIDLKKSELIGQTDKYRSGTLEHDISKYTQLLNFL